MSWYKIATPSHNSNLVIVCETEGGYGRYRLTAYNDKDEYVYSQFYLYATWHGHCHGQLLIKDFIEKALTSL